MRADMLPICCLLSMYSSFYCLDRQYRQSVPPPVYCPVYCSLPVLVQCFSLTRICVLLFTSFCELYPKGYTKYKELLVKTSYLKLKSKFFAIRCHSQRVPSADVSPCCGSPVPGLRRNLLDDTRPLMCRGGSPGFLF